MSDFAFGVFLVDEPDCGCCHHWSEFFLRHIPSVLGFGSAAEISRYWDLVSIAETREWLETQIDGERVRIVRVEGKQKDHKELYARADIADLLQNLPDSPPRIRALSPFDPIIRNRNRLEWLLGFEYRIEIYVPEEKRRWGYYVFPLLEGDNIIGRIDMRAKRKEDILEVKSLWLEPRVKMSNARSDRLQSELIRQARLGGVKEVVWLDRALQLKPYFQERRGPVSM